MNKSELLNWLREQQQQWQTLLDQVGPARMEQPGVNGDWSMKDLVAHLAGWQPRMTAHLQAALRGQPEPPPPWPAHLPTEDDVNAWIYESNRERSVDAVLVDMRQMFQQLFAVVEELPDAVRIDLLHEDGRVFHPVWVGGQRFAPGEFFYHFRDDHEPAVRAWLARAEDSKTSHANHRP